MWSSPLFKLHCPIRCYIKMYTPHYSVASSLSEIIRSCSGAFLFLSLAIELLTSSFKMFGPFLSVSKNIRESFPSRIRILTVAYLIQRSAVYSKQVNVSMFCQSHLRQAKFQFFYFSKHMFSFIAVVQFVHPVACFIDVIAFILKASFLYKCRSFSVLLSTLQTSFFSILLSSVI